MYKKNNYIIWIGSIYEENFLKYNKAISPASNYWQISFLKGLQYNQEKLIILSTHFQRIYPFGNLVPNGTDFWKKGFKIISSLYLNLPILKEITIYLGFKFKIIKLFKNDGLPKCVISYNPTYENSKIALYVKKKYDVTWIDLCADSYNVGEQWGKYSNLAKKANAHVFLSYFAYTTCPFNNLFHFDGGIDSGNINHLNFKNSTTKTLLYSGMLGEYGGVDILIESFLKIKNPNIKLVICGYGKSSSFFNKSILNDSRIFFYGLVSETELEKLYYSADIFINPRPEKINGGEMNFPSKIHKYLSFGKPIISTKTLGLAPEYDDYLFYFNSSSAISLEKVLCQIINWNLHDRIEYAERVKRYIEFKKNWNYQSKYFTNWLNNKTIIK